MAEELQRYLKEIEKLVENSRTPRERINLKKRKIEKLGGHVKKQLVPLKRIIGLKERRMAEKASKREEMKSAGIPCKRRRR